MVTPSRNEIYEAVIRRMVAEALREQDAQFAETHASDTARQLADYLYRCAMQLGHTPWPGEITGGAFLKQRFGTWEAALTAAKLPPPNTEEIPSGFARVKEETRRQKVLYREKKAEKKKRFQQRLKTQREKRKKHEKTRVI